uniref:Uncharacterized protein n=1 Tax=Eutreptiella gymnastica TaxID=73025 RepID=A0A7S1N713_9EUGL|mmetsp:Transcript_131417/g.227549  ORF Transcript_131417/g.227549 Transcript_131417/m.227549 type:complete len:186 (+) Transcript_131417:3-560(+)
MAEAASHFRSANADFQSTRVGLVVAAEWLGIKVQKGALHRALYDTLLAALILQRVMDPGQMATPVRVVYDLLQLEHPRPLVQAEVVLRLQASPDLAAQMDADLRSDWRSAHGPRPPAWLRRSFRELTRLGLATGDDSCIRLAEHPTCPRVFTEPQVSRQPILLGVTQEVGRRARSNVAPRLPLER